MRAATTRRPATPARWAAALDRARANGLHAFNIAGDPRFWFVTSGTTPGAGYTVSIIAGLAPTCLCPAGAHDPVCQHRALILDRLGLLPRPPALVAAAAPFVPRIIERAKSPAVKAALADLYGDDAA